MADLSRRLFAVQLIFLAVIILSAQVNGGYFESLGQFTGSMSRGLVRLPSKLLDGTQTVTQQVSGTVSRAVSPSKTLQSVVDATGGTMSKVLGSASRVLGKPVQDPQKVVFLYDRPIEELGDSPNYLDAVKAVISLALTNVILYPYDMKDNTGSVALSSLPILNYTVGKLKRAGAGEKDIRDIVKLLSRNRKQDITREMKNNVLKILKDEHEIFRSHQGPIKEIRCIARNPDGYYKMKDSERTDYNLKTNPKYTGCVTLYPTIIKNDKSELNH